MRRHLKRARVRRNYSLREQGQCDRIGREGEKGNVGAEFLSFLLPSPLSRPVGPDTKTGEGRKERRDSHRGAVGSLYKILVPPVLDSQEEGHDGRGGKKKTEGEGKESP